MRIKEGAKLIELPKSPTSNSIVTNSILTLPIVFYEKELTDLPSIEYLDMCLNEKINKLK